MASIQLQKVEVSSEEEFFLFVEKNEDIEPGRGQAVANPTTFEFTTTG
jgi:hypothetical protein